MPLIDWDDNYSVNIVEIDKQHQKLIDMINQLHEAMLEGQARDIIGAIVQRLVDYTCTHFKTEEDYFDRYDYPDTDDHKAQHRHFVRQIDQYNRDFEAGRLTLSMEVMNFLKDWLIKHIQGTDKDYTDF